MMGAFQFWQVRLFWFLILTGTVWMTAFIGRVVASPQNVPKPIPCEVEHLVSRLKNLDSDWNSLLTISRQSEIEIFKDERLCYSTLSPIIQDVIRAGQDHEIDYYLATIQFADWLLNDFSQSTEYSCLNLIADDIFHAVGTRAVEFKSEWSCDWTCSCQCDSTFTSMQNLFTKNNYTLPNKQPDKVKFCRELKKRNWSYLWQRYQDRCWTDCVRYGKCSPVYLSMHFALFLFLGAAVRRIYLGLK